MDCMKVPNSPQSYRQKPRKCTDTSWICLFSTFWCFLIVIIVFSISYGNYDVAIKGADSFGNICNQINHKHFENFTLSAFDTSAKPFLFYFDNNELESVVKICVEKCPEYDLPNSYHIFKFLEKGLSQVCRYDFNLLRASYIKDYPPTISRRGPCPPVTFRSFTYRNRCLPIARINVVRDLYSLLNSGRVDQLFFLAVYSSRNYVAILCGFSLGISLILFGMMFLLPMLTSWFIWLLEIGTNAGLCTILWSLYNKSPVDENTEEMVFSLDEKQTTNLLFILLDEFSINNILILCSIGFTIFIDASLQIFLI
ncbi:choline transporter-like 1 [Eupeodes corollae]|uniref:choline transporter-like 1 n=1 Tax=Eupeodes corollae TaxID=290404 RepID=UPI00249386AB|nr:choline transporter-like 1 [Eupeodes corollae]